ncbi:MAG: peptidylprolyl isomerase [Clostridiales bacterium]|jgi:cyclophilin family peptidyl-prolyl cis-trans isomerase|nr:peptidylprolyl isomerase [Clostridiales bacterium]
MKGKCLLSVGFAALFCAGILTGCSSDENKPGAGGDAINSVSTAYPDKDYGFQLEGPAAGDTIAILHTSMGNIKMRFFPEAAPKAVENFTTHAKDGYYNGLTFHRIINDFMIQGGDPKGTGTGGESIWGKSFEDEFDQKLLNLRGSVSMANSGVNTNGSQFFINQAGASSFSGRDTYLSQAVSYEEYYKQNEDSLKSQYKSWKDYYYAAAKQKGLPIASAVPDAVWALYEKNGGNIHLDGAWRLSGGHTVFAQVFEGMDVVDAIAGVKTDKNGKPAEPVTVDTVEITTYQG